jgi:hypothetical protein
MKTIVFLKNHGYKLCPICGEVEEISYLASNGVCRNCMRECYKSLEALEIENIETSDDEVEYLENLPDEILLDI